MPLSEHEQKMLDEMERQLFADDPRLARAFRPAPTRQRDRRRILIGIGGVILGLVALVAAVALPAIWLGVIAFIGMVAGAVYAVTAPAKPTGAYADPARHTPAHDHPNGFMHRMEERWERRSGDDPRV